MLFMDAALIVDNFIEWFISVLQGIFETIGYSIQLIKENPKFSIIVLLLYLIIHLLDKINQRLGDLFVHGSFKNKLNYEIENE